MKCSPSVTLLLQPSREALPKMALPRSQMRMSVLLRSRSLPSLKDWPKYLRSQVKVPTKFLKGALGALLSFSGRLLHICWLLSGCNSFVIWLIEMTLLVWLTSRGCARRPTIYSILWMYRMSGLFHRNIALMLVSIAVIPIMATLNAPSLSTKIGSIRPIASSRQKNKQQERW